MTNMIVCTQCGSMQHSTEQGLCAACLFKVGLVALGIDSPAFPVDDSRKYNLEQDKTTGLLTNRILSANSSVGSTLEPTANGLTQEIAASKSCNDTVDLADGISLHEILQPSVDPEFVGVLGKYRILRVIGHGGFGVVLQALDPDLDRIVAIKVLSPELAADPNAKKRFLREARLAASVNHPNIVEIHEINDRSLLPYLVMENVEGFSLNEYLANNGPMPLDLVVRFGSQLAVGLSAAHAQGLIHRDIKPSNILLDRNLQYVKISDFGLARTTEDAKLTRTGTLIGTPQYMSPEQANGEDLDHRSDLFSLGSVMYTMSSGQPPFKGKNSVAVLQSVCDSEPPAIAKMKMQTPKWLVAIVGKLMQKKPKNRFQSASEVADLLQQRLAHLQDAKPFPFPKNRLQNWQWFVAATILLALFGSFAITEATGVTRVSDLAATIFRIRTPEGTLVVKTDDPSIKIEVNSGGDVVIRGAGPQEFRLRPGKYRVKATGDGFDRSEWISLERNGRTVVQINMEANDLTVVQHEESPIGNHSEVSPLLIWNKSPYNGFTDLVRFKNQWYCCFREGTLHSGDAGNIRILVSNDAKTWNSVAVLTAENTDYRDPKLSVTSKNQLMLNWHVAVPATRDPISSQHSLVSFSKDGSNWAMPQKVLNDYEILGRITWHKGMAYGVAYGWEPTANERQYHATLYRSKNGLQFEKIMAFDLVNASEACVAFDGDVMYCLQRRDFQPTTALLGRSNPPYKNWRWNDLGKHIAGPNLIRDAKGKLWAAGRINDSHVSTAICQVNKKELTVKKFLSLPSGGDTGYPGLVWHNGNLWISYFSSHEDRPSVYIAKYSQ